MDTATAHNVDCKKMVTVYHSSSHTPAHKRDDVNYVELNDYACLNTEVKKRVGSLNNKVTLTPVYSDGTYSPNPIGNHKIVAMTVISKKDALSLLDRKNMTDKALSLARSILWGVNRQSFI